MQVRQDGVQVLVELTGHTANNRLGLLAMQAAPVQITWIGYPNSTGLQAVHYRFTGPHLCSAGLLATTSNHMLSCSNTPWQDWWLIPNSPFLLYVLALLMGVA